MLLRSSLCLVLLLSCLGLHAQSTYDVPFDKEHITDAARLKAAVAAMRKADALASKGGVDHAAAMQAYQEAYAVNPDNADLNFRMGLCQLNGPNPAQAVKHLQRAAELDPYRPRVHFLLGHALQLNARWDEAMVAYERHAEAIRRTPDPDRTYNMVDKRMAECRNGKAMMAKPSGARVTNVGAPVNTPEAEYGALVDGKGNLYFTSRRQATGSAKVNKVTNTWFEAIYHSRWGADGWGVPTLAQGGLNSAHNDATISLATDGQSMIIYRDEKNGGDLLLSRKDGETWGAAVPLNPAVNSTAQESSAWRTADGQWLYFVSSREGGLGGSDIYRSPWNKEQGVWGPAENLGPDINTIYDEEGVYAPGKGDTLYFASQGHNTMGGYDLFRSVHVNGRWSRPENLGWPINSPGDDQFLVLAADGRSGYFSSTRPGGMGDDDIYRVEMPVHGQVEETAMLASAGTAVPTQEAQDRMRLEGFIKGLKFMEPVLATVEVMSLDEPDLNTSFTIDPATGAFTGTVPQGNYALHINAKGYLLHSEHVAEGTAVKRLDVELKPAEPGSREVLRNIFFERNSYRLDSISTVELQALATYLAEHAAMRVEIGGHTDSDIGALPNQELSQARAQVVVNWLVRHGISPDRLEAKGYGDTRPVMPNDNTEHKGQNRRTEIRVL